MNPPINEKRNASKEDVFLRTMSISSRVALAGFGGALVGLSLARRQGGRRGMVRGISYGRKQYNLSRRWALSCAGFATVFEASRLLSPTSFFVQNVHLRTVGDYTLAGATAGAAFRGIPIQSFQNRNNTNMGPPKLGPRLSAGIFAGLILGFIPGVLVAGITFLEDKLKVENCEQAEQGKQDSS